MATLPTITVKIYRPTRVRASAGGFTETEGDPIYEDIVAGVRYRERITQQYNRYEQMPSRSAGPGVITSETPFILLRKANMPGNAFLDIRRNDVIELQAPQLGFGQGDKFKVLFVRTYTITQQIDVELTR